MARRKVSSVRVPDSGIEVSTDDPANEERESQKEDFQAQAVETSDDAIPTIEDFEDATFDVPQEKPKRKYTKRAQHKKKTAPVSDHTTDFVCSLIDVLGMSLAGSEGTLNDSERSLLTLSLNEVSARYSQQVDKYAGYIYPVCGVAAIALWGNRVLKIRSENTKHEHETNAQVNQQSNTPATTPPDPRQQNIFTDASMANGIRPPF